MTKLARRLAALARARVRMHIEIERMAKAVRWKAEASHG